MVNMVNDKIYELAKQAGLIEFEAIPGSDAVTPTYDSIVRAKKFAESLVQECIEQVWYTREELIDETISRNIRTRMAEHLGVTYGQPN